MAAKFTIETLEEKGIYPDILSKTRKGTFIARWEFYYTHGNTAEKYAAAIKNQFPDAVIVNTEKIWKPFRGDATVKQSSHFLVEFKI
ncbi:MAG: hypothetical protein WC979_00285 [Candidatus Pacearchaeota archaeon]|jgi:hypothetical protein|nr:hypothetical protein [Clostridia bacterium]